MFRKFELDKLKETNPAVVYCFEPEGHPRRGAGSEKWQDCLIPESLQHVDYLDAYLYAEDIILPLLRKNKSLHAEQLLDWILNIHKRIGNTLLSSVGHEAGAFTTDPVLLWHNGSMLAMELVYFMSGLNERPYNKQEEFLNHLIQNYQVNKTDIQNFIKLMQKILDNKEIKLYSFQMDGILKNPKNFQKGIIALNKMQSAYIDGHLSKEEKIVIDKIVKVFMWPKDVPEAMKKFTKTMVERFNQCSTTDIKEISAFLANLFYQFTDIHPFGNGNGRVGLCIINIFLYYYNLPSIMLRHPGDDSDPNSEYSKAIAQIDISREPLAKLIERRIKEEKSQPYSNSNLCKLTKLRVDMTMIAQEILKFNPDYDFESLNNEISVNTLLLVQKSDQETGTILILTELLGIASRKLEALQQKHKGLQMHSLFGNNQQDKKKVIIEGLIQLTGVKDWKATEKGGLFAWRECSSDLEANKIVELLNKLDIAKVNKATLSSNKSVFVVKCEFKDLGRMQQLTNSKDVVGSIQLK